MTEKEECPECGKKNARLVQEKEIYTYECEECGCEWDDEITTDHR